MRVAIVIDSWKLSIFKRNLDKAGFIYDEQTFKGNCILLRVEADSQEQITQVIFNASHEAAKAKDNN